MYTVATSHKHERQTRYYGSWLWLNTSYHEYEVGWGIRDYYTEIEGLVKLCQPRAGYAYVQITTNGRGWESRNVSYINIDLTDDRGRKLSDLKSNRKSFQLYASLEKRVPYPVEYINSRRPLEPSIEPVRQALHFVANGQPPNSARS